MNIFATIKRVVELWFRKDGNDVKITPNSNTYTGTTSFSLPPKTSGSGVLVGESETATLTNKTIAAGNNTISGLANANIDAAAAIDATKIGAGSVSNTEFGYLDGVTSAIQTQFTGKQSTSEKGQSNGYASLDSGGKVPASQLPSSVMEYQGTWNANTNSPTLADGTGSAGDVYVVSVAGTQNLGSGSLTFAVGDWVLYNGTIWEKSSNSNAVSSVFSRTGAVTAQSGDYTASQVTNTPAGNIAAVTVQAALDELDSEKLATADFSSTFATEIADYSYSTDWTSGTTKTVTHNLGTRLVNVTLYDNTTYETLLVDSEVRTDANTVDLTSSEAPSGSGWKVLVSKA
jgi:hypothetical protein